MVIGRDSFKTEYGNEQINKLSVEIEELSKAALFEPNVVYIAFAKGLVQTFTYGQFQGQVITLRMIQIYL